MIYLYGLFEGAKAELEAAIDGAKGLQGDLEIAQADQWLLVFSAHDDAEVLPKRRHMLAHTHVLERMIAAGTVLPARFGLVADNPARAIQLIAAQNEIIAREFARVRGHIELGLRIMFDRDAALEATLQADSALRSERDALAGKGAEAHYAIAEFGGRLADQLDRRRGKAQRAVLKALAPYASDHVLRKPEEDTEVLRAEFMLKADGQEAFIAAVQRAAAELDFAPETEPNIQIIGPVPMYNFVRLNLALDPDEVAA